jgi:hypothetical protein
MVMFGEVNDEAVARFGRQLLPNWVGRGFYSQWL